MNEHLMRLASKTRPVAGYVGGKKQLAGRLAAMIDSVPHEFYGEAFCGMAGVFFRRSLMPKVEAINDINRDIATLFRVLQNHHQAFLDMLRWQLSSRAEFERLLGLDPERLTDLQRAARFLFVQRLSFGGKVVGRTFGIDPSQRGRFDLTKLAPLLADVHERIAGVWIECLPWQEFLDRWDRPGALFFLDPPYPGTEGCYGRGLFTPPDFARLADRLRRLDGRFLMTVGDTPEIRELFGGFAVELARVTYTTGGGSSADRSQELIISGG